MGYYRQQKRKQGRKMLLLLGALVIAGVIAYMLTPKDKTSTAELPNSTTATNAQATQNNAGTSATATKSGTIGGNGHGVIVNYSYPADWISEITDGGNVTQQSVTIQSSHNLNIVLSTGVPPNSEDTDFVAFQQLGSPFQIEGVNYELLAAYTNDGTTTANKFSALFVSVYGSSSPYLPGDGQTYRTMSILNALDENGDYIDADADEMKAHEDFPAAVNIFKTTLNN
jgi:uncharacterized protein (UPF0333 family)